LNVKDTCEALELLALNASAYGIYNIGHKKEYTNIELAELIISKIHNCQSKIEFINDSTIRPYHDNRYAINSTKLESLGWKPRVELEKELSRLIIFETTNIAEGM
jgi:dTDP-glucose 4,6-dehydratase